MIKKYRNFIKENISYTKAVLRKTGTERDNEDYLKILDTTKKDGYTGLLTKLVFIDEVDIDEVLDIYTFIKEKGLDVSKLLKLSYEDISDMVFDDLNDDPNKMKKNRRS